MATIERKNAVSHNILMGGHVVCAHHHQNIKRVVGIKTMPTLRNCGQSGRVLLLKLPAYLVQRLIDISDDIIRMFAAYAKPDQGRGYVGELAPLFALL